jgi:hypothetical protein
LAAHCLAFFYCENHSDFHLQTANISLSLSLSLSHTHTHTHIYTHVHAHARTLNWAYFLSFFFWLVLRFELRASSLYHLSNALSPFYF